MAAAMAPLCKSRDGGQHSEERDEGDFDFHRVLLLLDLRKRNTKTMKSHVCAAPQ
jgi:hypothetical protein